MADGCDVHGSHTPKPLRIEVHHLQPLGMDGHHVLDDLLRGNPPSGGTRKERALARRGFDSWVAAGRPGHPVYQLEQP